MFWSIKIIHQPLPRLFFLFFLLTGILFLLSCGNDSVSPVKEKTLRRIGWGLKPDWLPNNSQVSGVSDDYLVIYDAVQTYEPKPGVFYIGTRDEYKLSDHGASYHAWSGDLANLTLIYVDSSPNTGDRLLRLDDLGGVPLEIFKSTGQAGLMIISKSPF